MCVLLICVGFTVSALESEDHLIFAGQTDQSEALDEAQCRRLFDLPGDLLGAIAPPANIQSALEDAAARRRQEVLDGIAMKNGHLFEAEMDKLDRWAEDRRVSLQAELDELDEMIKETKKAARLAPNLPEKLERQRALRQLESKRTEAWKAFDEASR